MYNDAGVNIHIHKTRSASPMRRLISISLVAKALGCMAITTERNDELAKRLAPFAEKHKIYVAFHNHTNNFPAVDSVDPLMDIGKYIVFNLDIGHYFAGTKGKSPVPVIEKYHDKIISLHLKDRTAEGRNLSWGQGQTPIKEVLQLLKKEKWPIYADIEVEYPIPKDSDPVKEVAICLQYCRDAWRETHWSRRANLRREISNGQPGAIGANSPVKPRDFGKKPMRSSRRNQLG